MRLVALLPSVGFSSGPVPPAGVQPVTVHNPWLVNDRVADTHNIGTMAATYVNAYTPDGVVLPTTDEQKAINIYNNQKRRLYHWGEQPPNLGGTTISDPTYTQNVFGWALCGRHATMACTIANAAGFSTIHTGLPGHNIYQVQYDGRWHMYDTMCTCYVYNRQTPPWVAGCDEIKADPGLLLDALNEKRACPGFLLCGDTPDWYANAVAHWSSNGNGVTTCRWTGDMDLHTGQSFERHLGGLGQSVSPKPHGQFPLPPRCPERLAGFHQYPVLAPVSALQGRSVYHPCPHLCLPTLGQRHRHPRTGLPPPSYQALLDPTSHDLATYNEDGLSPDLHAISVGTTAEAVFKISLPFYLTDASFSGDFVKTNASDLCNVQFSANGTNWTTVWTAPATGTTQVTNQSLRSNVYNTWGTYYIKIQIRSTTDVTDAGVSNFVLTTIFEHNKGAMAYLDKGTNHITVTFDNPAELQASGNGLHVLYKWREYDGVDWTIERQFGIWVTDSPATFTINTIGTKVPRTESILMEICPPDTVAPAPITDLAAGVITTTVVPLTWTATGDDGSAGTAVRYDIRYSTNPITDMTSFAAATPLPDLPNPAPAGTVQDLTATGLAGDTTYHFAIVAYDKANNPSGLSNVLTITTPDTDLPPARIADLAAPPTGIQLTSVLLTWTAPGENGDVGTATRYELRYSTSPITDMASFASAGAVPGVLPTPGPAGTAEQFTVIMLVPDMRWYFAIVAYDAAGQQSELSNVATVVTTPVKIGDINNDGSVNVADLQALAAAWGTDDSGLYENWNPSADLNTDGSVNVGDLQILISYWNS